MELLAAQLPRDDKESCKIWLLKASNDNSASNDDSASTDDFPTEDSNNIFVNKYNSIQKQLQTFCGRDDLISGFLSKSKGQLLRVATCFHVLFKIESPSNISETIEELPLKAAVNFIEVCCSHAFHITGRQNPLQDPDDAINGMCISKLACTSMLFALTVGDYSTKKVIYIGIILYGNVMYFKSIYSNPCEFKWACKR